MWFTRGTAKVRGGTNKGVRGLSELQAVLLSTYYLLNTFCDVCFGTSSAAAYVVVPSVPPHRNDTILTLLGASPQHSTARRSTQSLTHFFICSA